MQKINFSLKPRSYVRADGQSQVYLLLRIDGERVDLPTGEYIPFKNWNARSRALKHGHGLSKLQALKKMQVLETILERCEEIRRNAVMAGEFLTQESFQKKLIAEGKTFDFIQFLKSYIERNPDNWSYETSRSYDGALKLLEDNFSSINISELDNFRSNLEKIMCKLQNGVNTRKKRHRQFKTILSKARKEGYPIPDIYQEPIGVIKGNRDFLQVEELNKVISYYHSEVFPPNLKKTLRLFLFACFTGCRYSDLNELHSNNIVGDQLHYYAVKTKRFNKRIEAPLPEVARTLIPEERGKLFQVPTDQTLNRHLRRIFRIINIRKKITMHCARHTFGTLYIYLGGEITNLQQILGHSNIDTTMEYVKLAKRMEIHDQRIFDDNFSKQMRVITRGKGEWEAV